MYFGTKARVHFLVMEMRNTLATKGQCPGMRLCVFEFVQQQNKWTKKKQLSHRVIILSSLDNGHFLCFVQVFPNLMWPLTACSTHLQKENLFKVRKQCESDVLFYRSLFIYKSEIQMLPLNIKLYLF